MSEFDQRPPLARAPSIWDGPKEDPGKTLPEPAPFHWPFPETLAAADPSPEALAGRAAVLSNYAEDTPRVASAASEWAGMAAAEERDVHLQVPFHGQFQEGHGYAPGETQCMTASRSMIRAACDEKGRPRGVQIKGPGDRDQIALAEDRRGHITKIDEKGLRQGRAYLDHELGEGHPVVVGVSYKKAPKIGNVDRMTDHFMVVTGREKDPKTGQWSYTYLDPAQKSEAAAKGHLVVDERGMLVHDPKEGGKPYEVSMVRHNEPLDEHAEQAEQGGHRSGRRRRRRRRAG